jgi:NADH-quinone oxidoreductase subunit B
VAIVDALAKALQRTPGGGIILTSVDALIDWSRGQSLWAMPMGTACCAMELIAASFSKFDFDRLGTFPRPDPRHTDVMILAGTITRRMQPAVKRLYEQMADPKYVIAMGNCTVSGGIFYYDTYSVVRGADEFLPVDVYIGGCPPRPEALQDGVLQLRELIRTRSMAEGRTYQREMTLPDPTAERAGTTDPAKSVASAANGGETA